MTTRELLYIKTIADEKSMTRAAQKLFVTQPSLSHCVMTLEQQLGTRLFTRTAGGLVLTYAGEKVELTKNEFRILQLLLENRGKIVSREELMMRLWQSDLYVEENTLTVNVARLRKKLEEGGLEGVILTKPGRGYIIL